MLGAVEDRDGTITDAEVDGPDRSDQGEKGKMPQVFICTYCKKTIPLNGSWVRVFEKDRRNPEVRAHAECAKKEIRQDDLEGLTVEELRDRAIKRIKGQNVAGLTRKTTKPL